MGKMAIANVRAAGGTTNRKLGERFGLDVVNVRDFATVQAAIDYARTLGNVAGGDRGGSIVFFPPGRYEISASLTFPFGPTTHNYIILQGAGPRASVIVGDFNDWIMRKSIGTESLTEIRDLGIVNNNTAASSGAIRWTDTFNGVIENCYIKAVRGIQAYQDIYNCAFLNNVLEGVSGGFGIMVGTAAARNNVISGFGTGIRTFSVGTEVVGNKISNCSLGIDIGSDEEQVADGDLGLLIAANRMIDCDTGIYCRAPGAVVAAGNSITTTGTKSYGVRGVSYGQSLCFHGNYIHGDFSTAGVKTDDWVGNNPGEFVGNHAESTGAGVDWSALIAAMAGRSTQMNGTLNKEITFANLPTTTGTGRNIGARFDVSNLSNSSTIGGTAASGGSVHGAVMWNGSNWIVIAL